MYIKDFIVNKIREEKLILILNINNYLQYCQIINLNKFFIIFIIIHLIKYRKYNYIMKFYIKFKYI
jgi:hypothetical protein